MKKIIISLILFQMFSIFWITAQENEEILKKSKHGFGLPFGLWLNRHAPLRELVGDSLQSLRRRQYINPNYIDTLLNEQHREHASYYGVMIWVLVMLEQWLQSHSDGV